MILKVLSKNFDDKGNIVEVWISTRNADKYSDPEFRELHVRYIKETLHDKDKFSFPTETPNIKLMERRLPSGLPIERSKMLKIDPALVRSTFRLAWEVLWPNIPVPGKKQYYGIIYENYKKGAKPEIYTRYAFSKEHAEKIFSMIYNKEHGRPTETFVKMKVGEVNEIKNKKKRKPRVLFKEIPEEVKKDEQK